MSDITIPNNIASTLVTSFAYASNEIFDAYRWLRANNPLGVAKVEGFDPFWAVTKHADILEISRNNALFPSAVRATTLTNQEADARARAITGTPHLVRSLVQMDEPDHMKYRLLTQAWFMPQSVKKREADIRALAQGGNSALRVASRPVRFREGRRAALSAASGDEHSRRAVRRSAAHVAAHPGAVRRLRSRHPALSSRADHRAIRAAADGGAAGLHRLISKPSAPTVAPIRATTSPRSSPTPRSTASHCRRSKPPATTPSSPPPATTPPRRPPPAPCGRSPPCRVCSNASAPTPRSFPI